MVSLKKRLLHVVLIVLGIGLPIATVVQASVLVLVMTEISTAGKTAILVSTITALLTNLRTIGGSVPPSALPARPGSGS